MQAAAPGVVAGEGVQPAAHHVHGFHFGVARVAKAVADHAGPVGLGITIGAEAGIRAAPDVADGIGVRCTGIQVTVEERKGPDGFEIGVAETGIDHLLPTTAR